MKGKLIPKRYVNHKHIPLMILLTAVILLCSLTTISAATVNVDNTTSSIQQGLTTASGGDTILLAPGNYTGINNRDLAITDSVTIKGNGPTGQVIINAGNNSRIFTITTNVNVIFENITFLNGQVTGTTINGYGGAVLSTGTGTITFINCSFINNTATYGGAISKWSSGTVNVIDCEFTGNIAVSGNGGAIYNQNGILNVNNSTFKGNRAVTGGAIHNHVGTVNITGSIFTGNFATNSGGAIRNYEHGSAYIRDSIFTSNSANSGGAIANDNQDLNSHLIMNINDCTFNDNVATNFGGGIFNNKGTMSISANQMNGNVAGVIGSAIYNNGSMGILTLSYLDNSTKIVRNNSVFTIYAKLTDDMGNPVSGKDITFNVNKTSITGITYVDGGAYISYTPSSQGIVVVNGNYNGNNPFSIDIKSGELRYEAKKVSNLKMKTDKNKITVHLKDNDGNSIANKQITINVNGKTFTKTSDSKGEATVNYHNAWNYQVTSNFAGDDEYHGSKCVVSKRTDTILTLETNAEKITATLTDANRNPIADKEISFLVKGFVVGIDTTDANGVSSIYFKDANKFKVTAKFEGDNSYVAPNASSKPSNVTHNVVSGKVGMEKTGVPVVAILLVLITSIGLINYKRRE